MKFTETVKLIFERYIIIFIVMKHLIILYIFLISQSMSQGSAGSTAKFELRYLIDIPTAGMIPHGDLALDMIFFQDGGLLSAVSIGAIDYLLFGVSYGGANIIGSEKPKWNSIPGIQLRLRIINETRILPAIAIGFDTQGNEYYAKDLNRYSIKSTGFYAAASKNYRLLGNFSIHGGINYSLEYGDGDKDPNLFIGAEKSVGSNISILAEYNFGLNDSRALGKGRGYLNSGARISVGKGFSIGLNFKDILKNQKRDTFSNRTMMIEYIQSL